KSKLDLAWGKIENGKKQEAEGRKLWIEGTLELINILDDARNRLGSDKAFGTWLSNSGYGDRITRHDRTALLNMAKHPALTRKVLGETTRRSWQLIWRDEIQPQLPNARQPADGEKPEEAPDVEQPPKGEQPEETPNPTRTRRPKMTKGAKQRAEEAQENEW